MKSRLAQVLAASPRLTPRADQAVRHLISGIIPNWPRSVLSGPLQPEQGRWPRAVRRPGSPDQRPGSPEVSAHTGSTPTPTTRSGASLGPPLTRTPIDTPSRSLLGVGESPGGKDASGRRPARPPARDCRCTRGPAPGPARASPRARDRSGPEQEPPPAAGPPLCNSPRPDRCPSSCGNAPAAPPHRSRAAQGETPPGPINTARGQSGGSAGCPEAPAEPPEPCLPPGPPVGSPGRARGLPEMPEGPRRSCRRSPSVDGRPEGPLRLSLPDQGKIMRRPTV